jgi:hypothetical protein
MTNSQILDKIDSTIDELDRLINQLTIPNKKQLTQQLYNFFADVEQRVEENF